MVELDIGDVTIFYLVIVVPLALSTHGPNSSAPGSKPARSG